MPTTAYNYSPPSTCDSRTLFLLITPPCSQDSSQGSFHTFLFFQLNTLKIQSEQLLSSGPISPSYSKGGPQTSSSGTTWELVNHV